MVEAEKELALTTRGKTKEVVLPELEAWWARFQGQCVGENVSRDLVCPLLLHLWKVPYLGRSLQRTVGYRG